VFSDWLLGKLSHCFSVLLYDDLEMSSGFSLEGQLHCGSCALGNLSVLSHCFSVLLYSSKVSSGFSLEGRLHCGCCELGNLLVLLYSSEVSSGFSFESLHYCFGGKQYLETRQMQVCRGQRRKPKTS